MTRIGIGLIFTLLLAACGAGASSKMPPTAAPTRTPVPTYTPTAHPTESTTATFTPEPVAAIAAEETTPNAAPLLLPTATSAPAELTATAAPAMADPLLTVTGDAVNVRGGPGTDYPLAGLAVRAASYPITGRNAALFHDSLFI